MTTVIQQRIPVPTTLKADLDAESVASELTDPQGAWSESLVKVASIWNPYAAEEMTGSVGTKVEEDEYTESGTETEEDSETDYSSDSSDGYESDEEPRRVRKQSFLKKERLHANDVKADDSVGPIQAIVNWFLSPDADDEMDCCSVLSASDKVADGNILCPRLDTVRNGDDGKYLGSHKYATGSSRTSRELDETVVTDHTQSKTVWMYPDHVMVTTEALALCDLEGESSTAPFEIRNNFVGIIKVVAPEAKELGLRPGMRVASIAKCEFNEKDINVPVDHLYIVPKALDAADMAALFAYYLPAFQALHHGRSRPSRYSRISLKGRRILVTGGSRLEAQAVLRLARLAGATELYVIAPIDYHPLLGKIEGLKLLEDFPRDGWLPQVRGSMDLVIDYEFPDSLRSIRQALAPKGRLVCIPTKRGTLLSSMYEQYKVSSIKRASLFDFSEGLKLDLEDTHKDVQYLLKQLTDRHIRPSIDRIVKLNDVPMLFDKIQGCPLSGAIICEPIKEYPDVMTV